MDDFDKFKYLLGETIMLYQFMENDLKLIYAGMLTGDFYKNIEYVRTTFRGLGQVSKALEEFDTASPNPYFDRSTYYLLSKLARQRNYYCHQCCVDFAYNPNFKTSPEFLDAYESLIDTNKSIKRIQAETDKHRKNVLEKFNRV